MVDLAELVMLVHCATVGPLPFPGKMRVAQPNVCGNSMNHFLCACVCCGRPSCTHEQHACTSAQPVAQPAAERLMDGLNKFRVGELGL